MSALQPSGFLLRVFISHDYFRFLFCSLGLLLHLSFSFRSLCSLFSESPTLHYLWHHPTWWQEVLGRGGVPTSFTQWMHTSTTAHMVVVPSQMHCIFIFNQKRSKLIQLAPSFLQGSGATFMNSTVIEKEKRKMIIMESSQSFVLMRLFFEGVEWEKKRVGRKKRMSVDWTANVLFTKRQWRRCALQQQHAAIYFALRAYF